MWLRDSDEEAKVLFDAVTGIKVGVRRVEINCEMPAPILRIVS